MPRGTTRNHAKPRKTMRNYVKLHETMWNLAKPCKTKQNYAKPRETKQNHTKLCETTPKYVQQPLSNTKPHKHDFQKNVLRKKKKKERKKEDENCFKSRLKCDKRLRRLKTLLLFLKIRFFQLWNSKYEPLFRKKKNSEISHRDILSEIIITIRNIHQNWS